VDDPSFCQPNVGCGSDDLFVRRVDALGHPRDPGPRAIASTNADEVVGAIAWDGVSFWVIFADELRGLCREVVCPIAVPWRIHGLRVAQTGDVLDSAPVLIDDLPEVGPVLGAAAVAEGSVLVAYSRLDHSAAYRNYRVRVRLVSGDAPLDQQPDPTPSPTPSPSASGQGSGCEVGGRGGGSSTLGVLVGSILLSQRRRRRER
jgi:hypothetical protein